MKMAQPKAYMRGFLAVVLVGMFQVGLLWSFRYPIEPSNEQIVTYMLGNLQGMAMMVVAFYFGTNQQAVDHLQLPPYK